MNRTIGLILIAVAAVAIVSVGAFLYLTRDIAAPSADINASVQAVEVATSEGETLVFQIDQTGTTAEYNIYELLNGVDKTVVGTTDQVAGKLR